MDFENSIVIGRSGERRVRETVGDAFYDPLAVADEQVAVPARYARRDVLGLDLEALVVDVRQGINATLDEFEAE